MNKIEYELATTKNFELSNKELGKQIAIITKAIRLGKKAQWDVVFAIDEIIAEELWEDDFDSQKEFAEYMNLSNASISQYKGAMLFINATGINHDMLSVGNAYLLSSFILEDEKNKTYDINEYLEFEEWCKENGIDLLNLTQKSLRNAISEFRSKDEAIDEKEVDATEETSEELEECDSNVVIRSDSKEIKFALTEEQVEMVIKFIEAMNENK